MKFGLLHLVMMNVVLWAETVVLEAAEGFAHVLSHHDSHDTSHDSSHDTHHYESHDNTTDGYSYTTEDSKKDIFVAVMC